MTSACLIAALTLFGTLTSLAWFRSLASLRDARASREYWYQAHRELLRRQAAEDVRE